MFADVAADDGSDGAALLFRDVVERGLPFVPVIGIARSPSETTAALIDRARGVCLRLTLDDLERRELGRSAQELLTRHALERCAVDVVLDLGARGGDRVVIMTSVALALMRALPFVTEWRTLTLLASSFPESVGVVDQWTAMPLPRVEWGTWLQLRDDAPARLPTFGDYGIQYPDGPEGFDPRTMQPSANIRYTLEREWLLLRGQGTKLVPGSEQFPQLARRLVEHPSFMKDDHCRGCGDVGACAQGAEGYGSLEVWRRIGTVHHLTTTVAQLAALRAP